MINQKLNALRELLKRYDGGVKAWVIACKVSQQAFNMYFESIASTPRKLEVYRIGLSVLEQLQRNEAQAIQAIEAEYNAI